MIYLLLGYSITATLMAIHFRRQRDDFARANEIRRETIEATRRGDPPFLLDRGVSIVKEDRR